MIYILVVLATIGAYPKEAIRNWTSQEDFQIKSWQAIGEFHSTIYTNPHAAIRSTHAKELCEQAAKELGFKDGQFKCIRSK